MTNDNRSSIKFIRDFPPSNGITYDENLWHQQHGDSLVIINCKAKEIFYPEHWTPFSIKSVITGKEFYQLKNTTYAVEKNNFLLLNNGTRYASYISSDAVTESFTLNFTVSNLNTVASVFNNKEIFLLDNPFINNTATVSFIEKLYSFNPGLYSFLQKIKEYSSTDHKDHQVVMELLYLLLEELCNVNELTKAEIEKVQARKIATREELYKRLCIARDYIHSCYNRQVTLEQLSKACFMNQFHLLREFKKYFHTTPHQYLTGIRLQEAAYLIRHSRKTIAEIVTEVGFEDVSSFSRLFRKHFGTSPSQFRN